MSLTPGSTNWRSTISSSKIPTILGLNPWTSQYALWHEMNGDVEPAGMDERQARIGHYAELMLVPYWLDDHPGWACERTSELSYEQTFTGDYGYPAVATVDAVATGPDGEQCIIECKTTNDMSTWGAPGDPDAVPAHYYAQVMWQMGVSGIHRAEIIVLGHMQTETHPVEWDADVFAGLVDAGADWWASLEAGDPPALDESVATYETVRGLHPHIEKGAEVETDRGFALSVLDAVMAVEDAETTLQGLKTQALDLMGNAQHLTCEGEKIATRRARGQSKPFIVINKQARIGAD